MGLKKLGEVRLGFLDQIRAVAIIPVVIQHYHSDWLVGGGIGVGIFFALSGFLIATMLLEEETFDWTAILRFYVRRFSRIYPAYLLSITLTLLVATRIYPERVHEIISSLPGLLTFTNEPGWLGYGIGVLWTLQVEMSFYLAIPLFMFAFGRMRGIVIFSCLLMLSSVWDLSGYGAPMSLMRWGAALGFGSLLAVTWKRGVLPGYLSPYFLIIPACLALAMLLFIPPSPKWAWILENLIASLCGVSFIAAFLIHPTLPSSIVASWIGRVSYSIYLFHAVVIDAQAAPRLAARFYHLTYVPNYFVFGICVLGLSSATYYFVEKPGIRIGKAIIKRFLSVPSMAVARNAA